MAHINEPKGVDFLIKSPPLTDKEKKELSEFIKNHKHGDDLKKKRTKGRRRQMEKV